MKLITQAIANVFGVKIEDVGITLETRLGEIPGWDSMNAINLLVEIESLSGHNNLGIMLKDEMTIQQLWAELKKRNVKFE